MRISGQISTMDALVAVRFVHICQFSHELASNGFSGSPVKSVGVLRFTFGIEFLSSFFAAASSLPITSATARNTAGSCPILPDFTFSSIMATLNPEPRLPPSTINTTPSASAARTIASHNSEYFPWPIMLFLHAGLRVQPRDLDFTDEFLAFFTSDRQRSISGTVGHHRSCRWMAQRLQVQAVAIPFAARAFQRVQIFAGERAIHI